MEAMECSDELKVCLSIPFPSIREAAIAYEVLRVDAEPKRSGVSKKLSVDRNVFKIEFAAKETRQVRVAVHSFTEFLILVTQTMERFGPPRGDTYNPEVSIKSQEIETGKGASVRVSPQQRRIMLKFMEKHPALARNQYFGVQGNAVKHEMWAELAATLNACGTGAHKITEKWIKCWADWKSDTKGKGQRVRKHASAAGGGPSVPSPLTEIEERLLHVMGETTSVGHKALKDPLLVTPTSPSLSHSQEVIFEFPEEMLIEKSPSSLTPPRPSSLTPPHPSSLTPPHSSTSHSLSTSPLPTTSHSFGTSLTSNSQNDSQSFHPSTQQSPSSQERRKKKRKRFIDDTTFDERQVAASEKSAQAMKEIAQTVQEIGEEVKKVAAEFIKFLQKH